MKQIIIEVPDWVDYNEIKSLVRRYIEERADKDLTLEEFKKIYETKEEEMVEYSLEEELEFLRRIREKEKRRVNDSY